MFFWVQKFWKSKKNSQYGCGNLLSLILSLLFQASADLFVEKMFSGRTGWPHLVFLECLNKIQRGPAQQGGVYGCIYSSKLNRII